MANNISEIFQNDLKRLDSGETFGLTENQIITLRDVANYIVENKSCTFYDKGVADWLFNRGIKFNDYYLGYKFLGSEYEQNQQENISKHKVEGEKEDSGFKGFGYVDECCPHCAEIAYNIPTDRISLCPHCENELFPCSGCEPELCTWDSETQSCGRFEHSEEQKAKTDAFTKKLYESTKNGKNKKIMKIKRQRVMSLQEAITTLDSVIPPPDNKMVDLEHRHIAEAWQEIKRELQKDCETCKWRNTDSWRFYTYPCGECKQHAGDHYEKQAAGENI